MTCADQAVDQEVKTIRSSLFGTCLNAELVIAVLLVCVLCIPRLFGIVPDVVMSASMEPSIPEGSIVYIDTNANYSSVAIGDVVVRKAGEVQVLHRVVSASTDGSLRTKGDANNRSDIGDLSISEFSGVCLFHVPLVGYAYAVFDSNRALGISLIVLTNAALAAVSLRRKKKRATNSPVFVDMSQYRPLQEEN